MGRNPTNEQLILHKEQAISKLESYIDSLIQNPNSRTKNKSDKL
jgi:hypothetical protein